MFTLTFVYIFSERESLYAIARPSLCCL